MSIAKNKRIKRNRKAKRIFDKKNTASFKKWQDQKAAKKQKDQNRLTQLQSMYKPKKSNKNLVDKFKRLLKRKI